VLCGEKISEISGISVKNYYLFMQNEPNFVRRRRIASALMTRRYEDITILSTPENEPKTNPNLCRLGNLGKFHPPKSVNAVCD